MTTIFLHIPKTAGTTIRHQLSNALSDDEICFVYPGEKNFSQPADVLQLSAANIAKLKFVYGHIDHHFAASLLLEEVTLATILRNPIVRAISLYRHFMLHHLKRNDMTLRDAINKRAIRQLYNHQTRILSGIELGQGNCNDMILGVAQHNLASQYRFIGFTEALHSDGQMELLRLGLPNATDLWINKTPVTDELPPIRWEDVAAAIDCNQFDMKLYRFAIATRQVQMRHGIDSLSIGLVSELMTRHVQQASVGRFGLIEDGLAKGWAATACETVPEVVLFVRNRVGNVQYQIASNSRPDLVRANLHGTGHCGFATDIQPLLDGARKNDVIHAYAMSTMTELPNSPIKVRDAHC